MSAPAIHCPVSEGSCSQPGEAPTCTSNAGCRAFLVTLERRMADEGYCGSCYEFTSECCCAGSGQLSLFGE